MTIRTVSVITIQFSSGRLTIVHPVGNSQFIQNLDTSGLEKTCLYLCVIFRLESYMEYRPPWAGT